MAFKHFTVVENRVSAFHSAFNVTNTLAGK